MVTIIIDGQAGELRIDETAIKLLTYEETQYIRELSKRIKERASDHERLFDRA